MYPGRAWNYNYIAGNPNTTREYILDHYLAMDKLNAGIPGLELMNYISRNINIIMKDVLMHLNLRWNQPEVIGNANITLYESLALVRLGAFNKLNSKIVYFIYSANPHLDWETVNKLRNGGWNWHTIAIHPWFTMEHMRETRHYSDCFNGFLYNPNLTMDLLRTEKDYHKLPYWVCRNPGIKWKDIINNPKYLWDWDEVSKNPNITLEIIRDHPGIPWDWRALSRHPNITFDMIIENPDLPWNRRYVSLNPNITWDIVRDHPEWPWSYVCLSKNEFSKCNRPRPRLTQ